MRSCLDPDRRRLLVLLAFVVPLGFATKAYRGPLQVWVNDSLGGVWYEVFWCLVAAFAFPRSRPGRIAVWVFFATGVLETLQLWHPAFLETIRSTVIGRTLIGTSFAWSDFPHYAAGCLLGWYAVGFRGTRRRFIQAPGETADGKKTPDRF
jgi:hypothetical protein